MAQRMSNKQRRKIIRRLRTADVNKLVPSDKDIEQYGVIGDRLLEPRNAGAASDLGKMIAKNADKISGVLGRKK